MRLKDIRTDTDYALVRGKYDEANPTQVTVIEVGLHRQVHMGGRHVGFVKSNTADSVRVRFPSGKEDLVPASQIKRTWAEQEVVSGEGKLQRIAAEQRQQQLVERVGRLSLLLEMQGPWDVQPKRDRASGMYTGGAELSQSAVEKLIKLLEAK